MGTRIVKLLLGKCAEADLKDTENGKMPLSWATGNEYKTVVKRLLEKGIVKEKTTCFHVLIPRRYAVSIVAPLTSQDETYDVADR